MNKHLIQLISVVFIGVIITSCMGQSSNPMEKYSNLKSGEPTSEQSESQKYVPDVFTSASIPTGGEFADLKLQGTNEVNNANFLEGKEGVLYFKMTPKTNKITAFKIEIADFPISSRPSLISTKFPNVHGLKWTPPLGVIPNGQTSISLILKLRTVSTAASDDNLKGMAKEDTINLIVVKDNTVPTILGKTKLDLGIDEGQTIPYTIDIEDPASASSPNIPEIRISPYIYSNTEAFRVDGSRYLILDYSKTNNPERLSSSKTIWRFYYLLKVDELPLDRNRRGVENPQSPDVDVCFHIMVDSVIGTQSVKEQICFKARFQAQAPIIQWDNDALAQVKSGTSTVIKFKVATPNGLGRVLIKNISDQISGLTGKKEIVCTQENADNPSSHLCELTWTPLCVKESTNKKLKIKLEAVTGKKTKSETFVKDFEVVPNEENCSKPVPIQSKHPQDASSPMPSVSTPAANTAPTNSSAPTKKSKTKQLKTKKGAAQ